METSNTHPRMNRIMMRKMMKILQMMTERRIVLLFMDDSIELCLCCSFIDYLEEVTIPIVPIVIAGH